MGSIEATAAFTAELQRARAEGVRNDGNLPFVRSAATAPAGVLLVHGFTASPWEMRTIGESLHRSGLTCLAVRLPGHGTTPEDLAERSWQEWLGAVESGHRLLTKQFKRVYGVGMSTGCLLLLALALRRALAGCVLFSPYLRISHRLAPYAGWIRHLLPFRSAEIAPADRPYYYARRPLAGIAQINQLLLSLRPRLAEVSCPVLAFNGLGDRTVDAASGRELVDLLGSPLRVHQMLGPETPHVLVGANNPHRQEMFRLTAEFIATLERRSGEGEWSDSDRGRPPAPGSPRVNRNCR